MNTQLLFLEYGIGSWVQDFITTLPTSPTGVGSSSFEIGKNFPTDMGFIYGLACYADGVDSANNPLITTTQAQNMYLCAKDGATEFITDLRLSDMLNEFAGSPVVRPEKYMPINIPSFDLSKSVYKNPLLFAGTNITIRLKVWYIQTRDWDKIKDKFSPTERPSSYAK